MRFDRLDLNLLVALDALLTERSVSLAADRIALSQSATSSALGRLREYFGDDLLVQMGRQMVLTARAEELQEPVREVLDQVRRRIAVPPPFVPETSERAIRIMASDYVTEVLLTKAINRLRVGAPNMTFEIQPYNDGLHEALQRGLTDILITIEYAVSADHPSAFLFEDDYVVIGCRSNPAMEGEMTREKYFDLPHVTSRFGQSRVSAFDDWFMRQQKRQRRIEVVAPCFMSLPGLVLGSDRVATMHRKLADPMCDFLPLVQREVPLDIPPVREHIQWHISNSNDPAIQWVVTGIKGVAAEMSRVNLPDDKASDDGAPVSEDQQYDQLAEKFRNEELSNRKKKIPS